MTVSGFYTRSTNVIGWKRTVESVGVNYDAFLESVEPALRPKNSTSSLVSARGAMLALELLAKVSGVEDVGLRLTQANSPNFANFGPVVLLARTCKTLYEWAIVASKYWGHHTNANELQYALDPITQQIHVRLVYFGSTMPLRQSNEHGISSLLGILRTITQQPDLVPTLARFSHQPLGPAHTMQEFMGCPIEFGAPTNEMVLPFELWDYPLRGDLSFFSGVLQSTIQSQIDLLDYQDGLLSSHVKLAIACIIGSGQTDAKSVADLLGVHPKALQRELSAENCTFSELLEETRSAMARDFLAAEKVPIVGVAKLLDYSANPSFTLAFRKWTGTTPSKWRQK